TGQGQKLRDLLGRELAGIAAAWPVAQHRFNGPSQVGLAFGAFNQDQFGPRTFPATPPGSDRIGPQFDVPSNVNLLHPVESAQNDLSALRHQRRRLTTVGDLPERSLLTFRDRDLGRRPWHGTTSLCCSEPQSPGILPKMIFSSQKTWDLWY